MKQLKGLVSFGNRKLPKTTAIFNLGSAHDCPSMKLGMCIIGDKCYALKTERLYPQTIQYRRRQLDYWNNVDAMQFAGEFMDIVRSKRNNVNALRINESGDFYTQEDVDKIESIAHYLSYYSINVYAYTARNDLDYSKCENCTIIASGFAGTDGMFIGTYNASESVNKLQKIGIKSMKCPADCKKCVACLNAKTRPVIIYAEIH